MQMAKFNTWDFSCENQSAKACHMTCNFSAPKPNHARNIAALYLDDRKSDINGLDALSW
jgi:hypothetical protein